MSMPCSAAMVVSRARSGTSGDGQPLGRAWLTAALVAAGHDGRLDPSGIVLVPLAGLYLDLILLWRRDDLSPALSHFLTVIDRPPRPS